MVERLKRLLVWEWPRPQPAKIAQPVTHAEADSLEGFVQRCDFCGAPTDCCDPACDGYRGPDPEREDDDA